MASRTAAGRSVRSRICCLTWSYRYIGPGLCASMPTASMQTSGPRPPVISRSSAGGLGLLLVAGVPPAGGAGLAQPVCRGGLLEPVVVAVDDDDPFGAHEHGRAGGHLAYSPGAPHRDDVTRPHLG